MIPDPFLQSTEWRVMRMRALERDGAKCACCGATAASGATMNVDHIKPRIRYPELALTLDNLQVLCDACNHGKGNKFQTDWRRPSASAPQDMPVSDYEAERLRQMDELRAAVRDIQNGKGRA